jgi:hypothetical protein
MSTEIRHPEFELEKAGNGLAMAYDRERFFSAGGSATRRTQRLRMRKAQQMATKLRLKLRK